MILGTCEAKESNSKRCWRHAEVTYQGIDGVQILCKMHELLRQRAKERLELVRVGMPPDEEEHRARWIATQRAGKKLAS